MYNKCTNITDSRSSPLHKSSAYCYQVEGQKRASSIQKVYYFVTKKKGWNSNKVFQAAEKSGFCGRELLPLVCTLGFVTLQTVYMHKKLYNTLKGREKMDKHNRSSLKLFVN